MDSLSPGPVRKPFTERRWRNLLTDIHDGQVGVIAGPELAVGSEAAVGATLYGYLARELTRRLGVDADRPGHSRQHRGRPRVARRPRFRHHRKTCPNLR
jgi:hypothetical protein